MDPAPKVLSCKRKKHWPLLVIPSRMKSGSKGTFTWRTSGEAGEGKLISSLACFGLMAVNRTEQACVGTYGSFVTLLSQAFLH